jgi:hypothetical protein
MSVKTYRDLDTGLLPDAERFGLRSQMSKRRAASNCVSSSAVDPRFMSADQARDLEASIDRVRQLLYGLRREKERQLAVPLTSFLLFFFLSATTLVT